MYFRNDDELLLEKLYRCIHNNVPLESVGIPHSDVFYVRAALEERFKCDLSLEQVEEYMRSETDWTDGNN